MSTITLKDRNVTMKNTLTKEILSFKYVQKIDITSAAAIAIENGLVLSFIQPWFIEPASIKIVGSSYLGAYDSISNEDKDVENIMSFFNSCLSPYNYTTGTSGNKAPIELTMENNPSNTKVYIGYIKQFEFNENVEKAYLLDYTIDFVGRPSSWVALNSGTSRGKAYANGPIN